MNRFVTMLAACAAALALGGGAAFAQEDTDAFADMNCVYDALIADGSYELVAESYLFDDLTDEELDTVAAIVDGATEDCAAEHSWIEDESALGLEFGVYGSVVDYLAEELLFAGVSEATLDNVFVVIDGITEDDLTAFIETDWQADKAFVARHKAALVAAGIPDDDDLVMTAMDLMETSALASDVMILFMMAGMDEES